MRIFNVIRGALFAAGLLTASASATVASPFAAVPAQLAEQAHIKHIDYYYYPRRDCYRPYYRRHYSGYNQRYYRPYRHYSDDRYRPSYYSYTYRPKHYYRDDYDD